MNLRKILRFTFAAAIVAVFTLGFVRADDEILRAMRDEIKRSTSELRIDDLEKPYYVEYKISVKHVCDAKAVIGALTDKDEFVSARLDVQVRVGDYKFDNTNFFDFGLSLFGSGDDEESFQNRRIPIELDYETLRRELWLATDAAYKQSAEVYSKKKAALKNRARTDTTRDFIKIEPRKYYDESTLPESNLDQYADLVKEVSEIFSEFPSIQTSTVSMEYIPEAIYYVNSEGMEYVKKQAFAGMEIIGYTQAEDGMPLTNFTTFYGEYPSDFPTPDSLKTAAYHVAETLVALAESEYLPETYSGPIYFEGQAAAEFFAQIFAPNLVAQRPQMTENGMQDNGRFGAFQTKIGGRVLPEFLSVEALPSLEVRDGEKLIGAYDIDDQGIPAVDVSLVEDGYLKNLLSSRTPTKRVRESNGHMRDGAAMLSVIEMTSKPEKIKSDEENVARMLELCEARELPYGLVVRKLLNQNVAFTTLFRLTSGDFEVPRGDKQAALVVYKVFPDGREEIVRGCTAKNFNVQSFKDILSVGEDEYVLNYLAPAVVSPFVTGGDQYVPTTVIVPNILIEDGEVSPPEGDFPKPPAIARPE